MEVLNLTPNEWGLYTVGKHAVSSAAIARHLNEVVAVSFRGAALESLSRRAAIPVIARIYRPLAERFAEAGFADTEGRYGIETAAVRYLREHGAHDVAESLDNDFLLWEA